MKILMLSGDPKILIEGSNAHSRARAYATLFDELHILITSSRGQDIKMYENLSLYSTGSRFGLTQRIWMLIRGLQICRQVNPTLITSQSPDDFGLIGFIVSKVINTALQLQIHTDIFSPFYKRASVKEWLRYHLAKTLIPRASCLRVVSKRIKDSITRELGVHETKISVLPIFTDITPFREARRDPDLEEKFKDFDFRMVSVGRFVEKEKNFSLLLDTMVEVRKEIPRSLLVIVGEGPDRSLYDQKIAVKDLRTNVMIEPWREDLPIYLKSFNLFLVSSNYEGWGRVSIEAMAAGLPIITTDVGLVGEVIQDNVHAIVVQPGDKSAIVTAVVDLWHDGKKRSLLRQNAIEKVEELSKYTWRQYLEHYERSLSNCGENF
jgi:glycosyltransferase involved in cell wall biosynthesis